MADQRESDSDLSSIAWPGFVDILSAVIIMFVFFVMVTAVALYFHTITYKSKRDPVTITEATQNDMLGGGKVSDTDQETELERVAKRTKVLEEKIAEITEEKEVLEKVLSEIDMEAFQAKTLFTESKDQKLIENYNNDPRSIVVFFGADSISVTDESKELIDQFIRRIFAETPPENLRAEIYGGKNIKSPLQSVARQLTVARMLNVRNSLLQSEFPSQKIKVRTIDGDEQIENSYHWVRLTFKDANN